MPSQLPLTVCLLDISGFVKSWIHINYYRNVGKLYFFFLRVYTKTGKLYSGPQIRDLKAVLWHWAEGKNVEFIRGQSFELYPLGRFLFLCWGYVCTLWGNWQWPVGSELPCSWTETFLGCYPDSSCYFQTEYKCTQVLLDSVMKCIR